jgi:hypothetical protein
LLDREELLFPFQRPTRFVDMEGGPAIFAEPSEIADRYHKALKNYLEDLRQVVLATAVDYQLVDISESYESVLTRFLIDRSRGRGRR